MIAKSSGLVVVAVPMTTWSAYAHVTLEGRQAIGR